MHNIDKALMIVDEIVAQGGIVDSGASRAVVLPSILDRLARR
jgi:hypothetical protein